MHGLCHTYQLPFAHYLSWSMSRGFLLAKVSFTERLWKDVVYPRYREFADLWALRVVPERMTQLEKDCITREIEREVLIEPIQRLPALAQ